jgi:hypothetical protein
VGNNVEMLLLLLLLLLTIISNAGCIIKNYIHLSGIHTNISDESMQEENI